MKLYKIRDWSTRYENNRTRELKRIDWVPVPNSQDGEGYTLLIAQPDGPALLGAWLAILQVASRCGIRGTLLRDTQKPHDSASLSRLTRFPQDLIQRALDFLSSDDMQWMEVEQYETAANNPASSCENPAPACGNPAASCPEWKGMEGKEVNGKGSAPAPEKVEREPQKQTVKPASVGEINENMRKDGFPEAWADWVTYRQERAENGEPFTSMTRRANMLLCERYGTVKAVAVIRFSISKSCKSLVDPKPEQLEEFMPASQTPDGAPKQLTAEEQQRRWMEKQKGKKS